MENQQVLTISALLRRGAAKLTNSPTPMLDARLLLMAASSMDEAGLISASSLTVSGDIHSDYEEMIIRREAHEPIAYIIGYKEFWKGCYRVTHDVLVPRADSECLIEAAIERRDGDMPKRILDLGTGSGCLLGALLTEFPCAFGVGVDISQRAALVAFNNMNTLGLVARAKIIQSKWFDAITGRFDIIISNPPYISQSDWNDLSADIRDYEPVGALISDDEGRSDYQLLFARCREHLKADGLFILEIGDGQADYLYNLALQYFPSQIVTLKRDLSGQNRALIIDNRQK